MMAVPSIAELRHQLHRQRGELNDRLLADHRIRAYQSNLRIAVDRCITSLWRRPGTSRPPVLVAVGGYGRCDLFPYSDVDILVLLPAPAGAADAEAIERFIGAAWDCGIEISHSVRTIDECLHEAARDVTILTAILEARFLCGSRSTFDRFRHRLRGLVEPTNYFKAKKLEQEQRHARYLDSPYSLEPNVKESPGALRDLHLPRWIALAAGWPADWTSLGKRFSLPRAEVVALRRHERWFGLIRAHLHLLAGRREDRLLFDHQKALAARLGFRATHAKSADELFMQSYFLAAKSVLQLNTFLVQGAGAGLLPEQESAFIRINERFCVRRGLLDTASNDLYESEPTAILETFNILQQHPSLKGVTANTLRALWRAGGRIDRRFRSDPANISAFLAILREPRGIVREFRRMSDCGVLGRYIPEFGRIIGQMQHDLFHAYTVDQHILTVLRNIRRFAVPELAHEFPLCSELMSGFDKPWLLYIAALFHDIAKGRGGDHSELGARDAYRFCRRHRLPREDINLVVFLVREHLRMSAFAQKRDITDPDVVREFAARVATERNLIALYLLTVADIRGTSPKVWNAWKAKLLEDLFRRARRSIRGDQLTAGEYLAAKQAEARRLLRLAAEPEGIEAGLWSCLDTPYFLGNDAPDLAWHARSIGARVASGTAIVAARPGPGAEGLQVMVYCPDRPGLFSRICAFFDQLSFTIADARVHTARNGCAIDTFVVMSPQANAGEYRNLIHFVESGLREAVTSDLPLPFPRHGRVTRRARHFPVDPTVDLRADERGVFHVLSIVAGDRQGLLYAITRTLHDYGVNIHSARVNTLGDRAEDVFLVSGPALAQPKAVLMLEQELLQRLAA